MKREKTGKIFDVVRIMAHLAKRIGDIIKNNRFDGFEQKNSALSGHEKNDELGRHSIVTKLDIQAQNLILEKLGGIFPKAKFIAEEKPYVKNRRITTTPQNIRRAVSHGLTFGVDALDGSAMRGNDLPEYTVSVGAMKDGVHIGGAIYAPEIAGGMLVFGEQGRGVRMSLRDHHHPTEACVKKRSIRNSVVCIGVDTFLIPQFNGFAQAFSKQIRTTISMGSGAIALALVAAGRLDAVVQPVQYPWDWFAGYPLVLEAGGSFQFYHYRNGQIVFLDKPDLESYNVTKRNVAYIAGTPHLVKWLSKLLVKTWS